MSWRILLWHGKVAMPETWKVQAGRRHRGQEYDICFPNTETHPQLRETKRGENVYG